MSISARTLAQNASFQAFVNCYLREVDPGRWRTIQAWQADSRVRLDGEETHVVELDLPSQDQILALGVAYRSRAGRHTLTSVHRRRRAQREWKEIDVVSTLLLLIDALYAGHPESAQRLELVGRVVESLQVMTDYLEHQLAEAPSSGAPRRCTFLESERSVVFGHWLHPTPKSRQGMHGWQHEHFAPELGGRFQLHFFAAERALVLQESIADSSGEEISRRIASHGADAERREGLSAALGDERVLLPVHPLQAQWLLHQDYVRELLAAGRLVDLGRLGAEFTPTSSVRTLYSEQLDFMIKLSLPVKITNSLRINLQTELGDSVWISQLLRACELARDYPELRPIEDPAYVSIALEGREETGFEAIFRHNPFVDNGDVGEARTVHSIAALVQNPIREGRRSELAELVHGLATRERISLEEASRRWFEAYWKCSIEVPIRIYDRYGIALEAHQQNSLLEFDASGLPRYCYYRDIQGLALSEHFRGELIRRVPQLEAQTKVFEADDIVRNGLGYYLVFNQLYSVIHRFGVDELLSEESVLGLARQKLGALRIEMKELGAEFIDVLLEKKAIPCKANLLTRVADMDELQSENELAVYAMIDNPLHRVSSESAWSLTDASAGTSSRQASSSAGSASAALVGRAESV